MLNSKFKKSSMCEPPWRDWCVEAKLDDNQIVIRNSRYKDKTISYTRPEWASFIRGVKGGEFDLPNG